MADRILSDIDVTTTVQTLVIAAVDKYIKSGLFVINHGPGRVTFRVYGSPTGATVEAFTSIKSGHARFTQAEIDLQYILLFEQDVASDRNEYFDLSDYTFDFIKITAQVDTAYPEGSGSTAVINWALQKASSNIG